MLRITAGRLRGYKLDVPRAEAVRPPLEMVRQAIFNILGQDLSGSRVVDLFAGSGVMGIEALSRGAEFALIVEKDRRSVETITRNLEKTRLSERAEAVSADAFHPARYLGGRGGFDVVFVDPPFAMARTRETLAGIAALVGELFASDALTEDAVVVLRVPVEHEWAADEAMAGGTGAAGAAVADERVYGSSRVLFFTRRPAGGAAQETGEGGEGGLDGGKADG